jgi:hypothetical protein
MLNGQKRPIRILVRYSSAVLFFSVTGPIGVRSLMRVLLLQRSILGNTPWSLIKVNDNKLKTSRHSDGRECDRI